MQGRTLLTSMVCMQARQARGRPNSQLLAAASAAVTPHQWLQGDPPHSATGMALPALKALLQWTASLLVRAFNTSSITRTTLLAQQGSSATRMPRRRRCRPSLLTALAACSRRLKLSATIVASGVQLTQLCKQVWSALFPSAAGGRGTCVLCDRLGIVNSCLKRAAAAGADRRPVARATPPLLPPPVRPLLRQQCMGSTNCHMRRSGLR